MNCEEIGDRYHIVSDACFVLLLMNNELDFMVFDDLSIHPVITPMVTMIIGAIFMYAGNIKIDDLIGDIHDIILPIEMDIIDRRIIGIIIIIFSVMLIILALDCADHIVATLNRME
jgi:hypothetical protein